MNVTVSRAELAKALALVNDFASKSVNLPMLNAINLTATAPAQLSVLATDLESAGQCLVAAQKAPVEAGSVSLPAGGLRKFVDTATGDHVRIAIDGKTSRARLECGRSTVSFRVTAEQFPQTPVSQWPPSSSVHISAVALASIFARTSFVNLRSDGLPIGDGEVNRNTSAGVRLVLNGNATGLAHDGHRMARCVVDISGLNEKFELTIPPRAAHWLSVVRWGRAEDVRLQRHAGGILFASGQLAAWFRVTDIRVPDTTRAFSPEFDYRATFDTKEFIRAVTLVGQFSDVNAKGGRAVVISFQDSQATVMAGGDFADAEAREEISCQHKAPAMEFEFDPRYLIEFARAVGSQAFDMRFNKPNEMCRFTHQGDAELVYVVGPRYRGAK